MTDTKLNGLILAGGKSRRMGVDKGLMNYSGKPQREHLFDLLSTCCAEVYTSCRGDQQVPQALHPLVDSFSFPGPINGILSAMQINQAIGWLIVAIDMPFIDEPLLRQLLIHRNQDKFATCFVHLPDNFPEPLLTIWEPASFTPLLAFAQSGNSSPRAFLAQSDIHSVHPPSQRVLTNINYPSDEKQPPQD